MKRYLGTLKSTPELMIGFDTYNLLSIKEATHQKWALLKWAVAVYQMCGIIERHSVPLLSNWKTFITSAENKQNPAAFLSRDIIYQAEKTTSKV